MLSPRSMALGQRPARQPDIPGRAVPLPLQDLITTAAQLARGVALAPAAAVAFLHELKPRFELPRWPALIGHQKPLATTAYIRTETGGRSTIAAQHAQQLQGFQTGADFQRNPLEVPHPD